MKPVLSLVLGVILIAAMMPGLAQDEAADCDTAEVSAELEALVSGLTESEDAAADFRAIRDLAAQAAAECSDLVFTSEEDGQQPVLGPIEIPEGLYRLTVTTTGYFKMEFDVLDGECDSDDAPYLYLISEGEADNGAQVLLESSECSALFSIDNTRKKWTLTFEKLK